MRPLLLAALVLVALLPAPAASQAPQFPPELVLEVVPFPRAAPVDGSASTTSGTVRYSTPAVPAPGGATRVSLTVVDAPEWIHATIEPATVEFTPAADPAAGTGYVEHEAAFTLTVHAAADAPAFQLAPISLRAEAAENALHAAATADATVDVEAAYAPALRAVVVEQAVRLVDSEIVGAQFNVTVENLGNGPTRVEFEGADVPAPLELFAPLPVVLESRATGGTHTTMTVTGHIAGTLGPAANGFLTLRVRASYAMDRMMGIVEDELTVVLEPPLPPTPPPDRRAPSPDALLVLALAGVLALARRR